MILSRHNATSHHSRWPSLSDALRSSNLRYAKWPWDAFDHPTLFTSADIDSLVIATIRVFLSDTTFEYAIDDARTFIRERSLVLEMEATSLRTRRLQSTASDSGSIQLPVLNGTDDGDFFKGEDLIVEIERMSID